MYDNRKFKDHTNVFCFKLYIQIYYINYILLYKYDTIASIIINIDCGLSLSFNQFSLQ